MNSRCNNCSFQMAFYWGESSQMQYNSLIVVEIGAWHILLHRNPERKLFTVAVHLQIPAPDSWANICRI